MSTEVENKIDAMAALAYGTLKCNCGAKARYIFDMDKGSCNKYNPCATYEEMQNQLALRNSEFYSQHYTNIRNATIDDCATLAETLHEDRFGKLPQFQVADAIREMKVEK